MDQASLVGAMINSMSPEERKNWIPEVAFSFSNCAIFIPEAQSNLTESWFAIGQIKEPFNPPRLKYEKHIKL